jgi:Domain of unknown function (DUF222)
MGNLQSAIDELATEDLQLAGPVAVAESLVEEFRQVERLQADALRRLAFVDASGAWAHEGSLSTQAWLRRHCRMAPGAAAERVRVARRLEELPEARDAFRSGDIGYAHVRLIAAAVNTSERCRDTAAEAEPMLVEAARELDPSRLRRAVEHWRHIVDAAGFAESEAERYDRRRLHLSPIMDGMEAIDGLLDAEGSATLKTALDPLAAPLPGDTRTPAQRRADALVEMARRTLDRGDLPTSGGERPHLNVSVELTTLEERAGAPAAELGWSEQPISGEAARRLACDAGVSRVITKGRSEPLDVGRRTRVVPAALRRAVIARDKHCTAPGCDRPWEWCDAHHDIHWIDGGPTALGNLRLLCHVHHPDEHERRHRDRSPPSATPVSP